MMSCLCQCLVDYWLFLRLILNKLQKMMMNIFLKDNLTTTHHAAPIPSCADTDLDNLVQR